MVKILTTIQMTAGDKLGKLLRNVMQINSCIDSYFETQPFHPHLSYNLKSGWVGLFQPHVDMSKLKDLSVISKTNFYIVASCNIKNILETEWKLPPNTFPVTSSLFRSRFVATHTLFRVSAISSRLGSWGSILASKHGLTRVDIGGSYRPELRFLKIKLCLFVSQ